MSRKTKFHPTAVFRLMTDVIDRLSKLDPLHVLPKDRLLSNIGRKEKTLDSNCLWLGNKRSYFMTEPFSSGVSLAQGSFDQTLSHLESLEGSNIFGFKSAPDKYRT